MDARINILTNGLRPPDTAVKETARPASASNFGELFQSRLEAKPELKFSSHAQERLRARNITLSSDQLAKMGQALDSAEKAGSRESLFVLKDLRFIVSVKNRTVVTALDAENAKNNVFTNIDSAVVLES